MPPPVRPSFPLSKEIANLRLYLDDSKASRATTEEQYLWLLEKLVCMGIAERWEPNRTGIPTVRTFAPRITIKPGDTPWLYSKSVHVNSVLRELEWFLLGLTSNRVLQQHGVTIWDEWADQDGELGAIYGAQWRGTGSSSGVDQLQQCVDALRTDPTNRRMLVDCWDVAKLRDKAMALPPCHYTFQFFSESTATGRRLNIAVTQRSADVFLGVPFNLASYRCLLEVIAHITDHEVGEVVLTAVDAHLYQNHMDAARVQLDRVPELVRRPPSAIPRLIIPEGVRELSDITMGCLSLEGYHNLGPIRAKVAV
jgi:thymidylate synthase